jgi:hypothetical protein
MGCLVEHFFSSNDCALFPTLGPEEDMVEPTPDPEFEDPILLWIPESVEDSIVEPVVAKGLALLSIVEPVEGLASTGADGCSSGCCSSGF